MIKETLYMKDKQRRSHLKLTDIPETGTEQSEKKNS